MMIIPLERIKLLTIYVYFLFTILNHYKYSYRIYIIILLHQCQH